MASIYTRANAQGETVHCVRWRQDGKQNTEPFEGPDAPKRAERFKLDVELAGNKWPALYWPRLGYVTKAQWDLLAGGAVLETVPDATEAATPLLAYARDRIGRLTGIQPRTRADYYMLVANYMETFPGFQAADLANPETITEDHIADWVNWLEAGQQDPDNEGAWLRAPKSPKTIANAHGLLSQILARATRGEKPLLRANPCEHTRLPSLDDSTGEEMVFLTPDELAILYRAADPIAQDVIEIAVGTAGRFGEYTAFQCGDWNLEAKLKSVRVDRAWTRTNLANGSSERTLKQPKTTAGRRTVVVDEQTAATAERLTAGRSPGEFMFTDAKGRPLTHGTFYGPHWQPTLYRAVRCQMHREMDRGEGIMLKGERVRYTSRRQLSLAWIVPCGCPGTLRKIPRIHDLRHTAVALLIAENIPLKAIAKRVGHESTNTTDKTYGHLLPELDEKQALAMFTALQPLRLTLAA